MTGQHTYRLSLYIDFWRIFCKLLLVFPSSNMSKILQNSPSLRLLSSNSIPRDLSILSIPCQNPSILISKKLSPGKFILPGKIHGFEGGNGIFHAWSQERSLQEVDDSPVSFELEPIYSESQFDRVIAEAQQLVESVIIVWMASWCRKCIYLKPKLEKLAADYNRRLRFYCVNVNNIPHKLVARAGVTVSLIVTYDLYFL
ncbi:hypothetical protein H0E87_019849 [Populus deltoides]|uniref:Thioredoxin domain-containing protein n=1 Tax=Populus deltoides TaxID=3696 RepID=A0A8T2XWV1_POPDE|nr:hypothetical protein H0E87_019849 [Populus deltoides]KAH8497320.1 hypothetical protein H0E87_019849 [Populus deltoides]